MPGSGKTTLGKKVANALGVSFIDLDEFIQKETGITSNAWILKYGEACFRILESHYLKKINQINIIISCGGGTPCFLNNIDFMKSNGKTIWLNTSIGFLNNRLENNKRAVIDSSQNLFPQIVAIYEKRLPFYKQADFKLDNPSREAILAILSTDF